MQIAIRQFGGVAPKLDPRRLSDFAAQAANDCDLTNGTLRGLRSTTFVATPTKVGTKQTIYRFGQTGNDESLYWFHWLDDVDVVKGQVAGDTEEKTYFFNDSTFGHPRATKASVALSGGTNYPMQSFRLGVPAPGTSYAPNTGAPGGAASGAGSGSNETRVYVYTWVTADGEEGPPSPPFTIVVQPGQTVNLTSLSAGPSGYNINRKRIYRTVSTFVTGTDYQFVAEIADVGTTYADNKTASELGEVIATIDYEMPLPTLRGAKNMPNGIMIAYSGSDVYFCEPYKPYTWPLKYQQPVDFPVVGIGVYSETAVVLTRGNPYVFFGSDPNSIVSKKLDIEESCVSKNSIVELGWGVMWASPNGLCQAGGQGTGLATEGLIDKEFWQGLNPSSIKAYNYDGRYVGFYNNGATTGGFIFDPQSETQPFSFFSTFATAGYNDPVRDALYLQVGPNIVRFDNNSTRSSYTWRSKKFEVGRRINFGWAKVEAPAFPVTLRVYVRECDTASASHNQTVLKATRTVTSAEPFRLPDGFTSDTWEVELAGTNQVTAVYLAQSAKELGQT